MKNQRYKRIAAALALLSGSFLATGCGSSQPSSSVPAGTAGAVVTPGVYGTGVCVPVSAQIPFTALNMYVDTANIYAGQLPQGQTVGQVTLGGTTAIAGNGLQLARQTVDGVLSLNVSAAVQGQVGYPANGIPGYAGIGSSLYQQPVGVSVKTGNAQGMLQISQATQQDIMYLLSGSTGYSGYGISNGFAYPGAVNTGYPTTAGTGCISGMALNLGYIGNLVNLGRVYLYFNNNPQQFYTLVF